MTGTAPDWEAAGRLIGERRRALGLPKNEASRQASISNTTWRLIEAGANRNPTDETLVRIAGVVGLDPDELLKLYGRGSAAAPSGGSGSSPAAATREGPAAALPARPPTLPETHTPYFVGREDCLHELRAHLERW